VKQFLFWSVVLAGLLAAGATGYQYYYASRNAAGQFRTKAVRRGDVTQVVNSTGTVQPVLSVQVGAFVSGPIKEVRVDFNAKVKKDQVLAQIDPTLYQATVDQNRAAINSVKANMTLQQANLRLAEANLRRDEELLKTQGALPESQYDTDLAAVAVAKANVGVQEAAINQAEAILRQAQINLGYCDIKSPVDGVVIDRKVDPGQTLAAQFQTPVMFVVAPDLEKRVYVLASVDEADIGLIRDAQKHNQPVTFTVDAYPKDSFTGHIFQVRLNPTTVSNVVTYTVVVEAANGDLKLLPGMTANLGFQIETRSNVLTVPNGALRFHPKPAQVRKSDLAIVEGRSDDDAAGGSAADAGEKKDSAARARKPGHVWVIDGSQLAAVEVVTGLAGKGATEILSGDLREGEEVVTSLQSNVAKAADK
jgi:HlyD family secretion protein